MRRALRRRILLFSLIIASVTSVLVGAAVSSILALETNLALKETNEQTLSKINCETTSTRSGPRRVCDVSAIVSSLATDFADYVFTRDTGFFLFTTPRYSRFPINVIDLEHLRQFRTPTTVRTVTGATWRLYSEAATVGNTSVEVFVGYIEDANWLIVPTAANPKIDRVLKEAAKQIGSHLAAADRGIASKLDAWAVVDAESGRVIRWSSDVPAKMPSQYHSKGLGRVHWQDGRLHMVRTDSSGTLVAVSLASVLSLWSLVATIVTAFIVVSVAAYLLSFRKFKRYFLLAGRTHIQLSDALRTGEGSQVEFKEDARDRDLLLKAITAFANSNDGTIFLGVSDSREIIGVSFSAAEQDRFQTAVQNAVRDRIRPVPVIDITFEQYDAKTVARVFVPRGEDPLYCLDGKPYLRKGPQSVAATGDEVVRTVMQFA